MVRSNSLHPRLQPVLALREPSFSVSVDRLVHEALAEDIGAGDVTSAIFPPQDRGSAHFIAKQSGVLSGSEVISAVFRLLDPNSQTRLLKRNGSHFNAGDVLAEVDASLAVLFTGERVALNFLQHLSGVATLTRRFADAVGPHSRVSIYDTRKTTPLLRVLEKRAVLDGGGRNHRFGLDDMAMLKNNHVDAVGGIPAAISRLRESGFFDRVPRLQLTIEARTAQEAAQATEMGADIVMLDNMSVNRILHAAHIVKSTAKRLRRKTPEIEVSGGVNLVRIGRLADLPINRISIGAITHSAPSVDISMRIVWNGGEPSSCREVEP